MHENRNLFLFLIEIINMHAPNTFYQYPGPAFGAGADGAAGAVFRDIEKFLADRTNGRALLVHCCICRL